MLSTAVVEIYKNALETDYPKEAFASDESLSSVWGDKEDEYVDDETIFKRYELAEKIYDVANGSVMQLVKFTGMTQAKFAKTFGMSVKTVESWSTGKKAPADYVKLLLAESCGYFD